MAMGASVAGGVRRWTWLWCELPGAPS